MSNSCGRVNKLALINTLLHAEVHNRMQEEQEMWKQHDKANGKRRKMPEDEDSPKKPRKKRKKNSKKRKKHKRHSESSSDNDDAVCVVQKAETNCSADDRWGHNGFMEMYPEEVISGRYLDSSPSNINVKSNDSDSSTSEDKPKKRKQKKKHKKHKKHK